jgi:hypothetical protein
VQDFFTSMNTDRHAAGDPNLKKTFPKYTPVSLALTLALELFSVSAHSSAAFGAYPICNARHDIRRRFETAQPDGGHTLLSAQRNSAIQVESR